MINVLIFDLDDTLFPEYEFVKSGFKVVDEWLRDTRSIQGFQEAAAAEFDRGARGDVFNRALQTLGVVCETPLVDQMVKVYRGHKPDIRLFGDAEWALRYFGSKMRLALLTDGYLHVQRRKVLALHITDQFQTIVYSDEFGRQAWKPSPIPYQRIAEILGCSPEECVYVGDNPRKDFVSAKRLGWFTVRVRRSGGEHFNVQLNKDQEADANVESLFALERTLETRNQGILA